MNAILVVTTLFCFTIPSFVHTADNSEVIRTWKDIFTNSATKKIECPYSSEIVLFATKNSAEIEKATFDIIYNHASNRVQNRRSQEERKEWYKKGYFSGCVIGYLASASEALDYAAQKAQMQQSSAVINLPEVYISLLVQWSYGIKRNGDTTEIFLNAEGTEKLVATPLLLNIINKYREHEQK